MLQHTDKNSRDFVCDLLSKLYQVSWTTRMHSCLKVTPQEEVWRR